MKSCIYEGQVSHRRRGDVGHEFRYGLFMMYLDLVEVPRVFRRRWLWSARRPALAWFDRRDHLGDPDRPLDECVRDLVQEQSGHRPTGPVRLLTHLRYFGYCFNPVSFYYCFDASGENLEVIVAEVNNTPWGEQYCYVLPESHNRGSAARKRYLLDKRFHVSPFMPMNLDYDWRFTLPGKKLVVHMKNYQNGETLFDATLSLDQKPVNGITLAGALVRHPFLTLKIIAAIHYQALRLWLKRTPFFSHPDKQEAPSPVRKS